MANNHYPIGDFPPLPSLTMTVGEKFLDSFSVPDPYSEPTLNIAIKKLSDRAKLPERAKHGDAGYDLFAAENVLIKANSRALVKTNIAMAIPVGFYGKICDRSGLALKYGLTILAGTIDSGYRNDIGVVVHNTSDIPFEVSMGDKIAQIIFRQYFAPNFVESEALPESDRGQGGFGHTGMRKSD